MVSFVHTGKSCTQHICIYSMYRATKKKLKSIRDDWLDLEYFVYYFPPCCFTCHEWLFKVRWERKSCLRTSQNDFIAFLRGAQCTWSWYCTRDKICHKNMGRVKTYQSCLRCSFWAITHLCSSLIDWRNCGVHRHMLQSWLKKLNNVVAPPKHPKGRWTGQTFCAITLLWSSC